LDGGCDNRVQEDDGHREEGVAGRQQEDETCLA
jgi:hypothetical protein